MFDKAMEMFRQGVACFAHGPCFHDETMWIYGFWTIVALYGSGLFTWWWWKSGKASSAYMFVTMIFIGALIENFMSVHVRTIYHVDGIMAWASYTIESDIWPLRKVVTNIALLALSLHMTIRAFSRSRRDNGEKRRIND